MGRTLKFVDPDGATPLEPNETAGLRFAHVTTRGQLDDLEQSNIEQGLRWLSRRRGGDVLTEEFLRKLHERMFGEVWSWAGRFRMTEKNIGINPLLIQIQLRQHLDDVGFWVSDGVFSPLEAAARFHHRLVQIHLFANGNGRHARIAADTFLKDYFDHPPIDWAGGFDLQVNNDRRSSYIASLREADRGYFQPLLTFVGA